LQHLRCSERLPLKLWDWYFSPLFPCVRFLHTVKVT
jgi:hypothetical protein